MYLEVYNDASLVIMLMAFMPFASGTIIDERCVHCPQYVNATAEDKEAIIFNKIMSTEYEPGSLPEWFSLCESNQRMKNISFSNAFDLFSDERPDNFPRFFHESGITAQVNYVSSDTGHNFTGLFKGSNHGLLRFSPMASIINEGFLVNYILGTYPFSLGLKMFRDGMHSGNIVVGDTNKGLGLFTASRTFYDPPDFNIFSRPLDNMVNIPANVDLKFGEFEHVSGVLGFSDFAAYDQSGEEEVSPKAPINVQLRPNPDLKAKFGPGPSLDFREWATTEDAVPVGTLIYTVWTTINSETGEPSLCVDENGTPQTDDDVSGLCPEQEVIKIGEVFAKSRFYSSKWVDDKLFFQHTRLCPKDQSKCAVEDNVDILSDLSSPPTLFAEDSTEICISDKGKDGLLTNVEPECPEGSSLVHNYCFPGTLRKVEEIQVSQCPYLRMLDEAIVFTGDEPITEDTSCTFSYKVQTTIMESSFLIMSGLIRTFLRLFG